VTAGVVRTLDLAAASALPAEQVIDVLGTSPAGLGAADAASRLERFGANAVLSHARGRGRCCGTS